MAWIIINVDNFYNLNRESRINRVRQINFLTILPLGILWSLKFGVDVVYEFFLINWVGVRYCRTHCRTNCGSNCRTNLKSHCRTYYKDLLWTLNRSVSRGETWKTIEQRIPVRFDDSRCRMVAWRVCFGREFEFGVFTMGKWLRIACFPSLVFPIIAVFSATSRKKNRATSPLESKPTHSTSVPTATLFAYSSLILIVTWSMADTGQSKSGSESGSDVFTDFESEMFCSTTSKTINKTLPVAGRTHNVKTRQGEVSKVPKQNLSRRIRRAKMLCNASKSQFSASYTYIKWVHNVLPLH